MTAGYSGTPLIRKLGIKVGYAIATVNAPDNYDDLLGELPDDVRYTELSDGSLDFVHAFYLEKAQLAVDFSRLKWALKLDGMLWISWAKKASKVPTDLTGDVVRELGLQGGLVDVKVCAVDAMWSGLKFVYRVEDR